MDQELRWAYAAGLVDGEGCVSVCRGSRPAKKRPGVYRYHVGLTVAMNDPESVRELADLWGRRFVQRTSNIHGKGKVYRQSSWITDVSNCAEVARLLNRMMPYLRAKKSQAQVVLAAISLIQAHFHKHYVPVEALAEMDRLYAECKALKKRNASVVTHDLAA
jgi:hypothetical protein